jgi:hypothetical protein
MTMRSAGHDAASPQNFDEGFASGDADRTRRLGVAGCRLEAPGEDPFCLRPLRVSEVCGQVAFDDVQDPQLRLVPLGKAHRAVQSALRTRREIRSQ